MCNFCHTYGMNPNSIPHSDYDCQDERNPFSRYNEHKNSDTKQMPKTVDAIPVQRMGYLESCGIKKAQPIPKKNVTVNFHPLAVPVAVPIAVHVPMRNMIVLPNGNVVFHNNFF